MTYLELGRGERYRPVVRGSDYAVIPGKATSTDEGYTYVSVVDLETQVGASRELGILARDGFNYYCVQIVTITREKGALNRISFPCSSIFKIAYFQLEHCKPSKATTSCITICENSRRWLERYGDCSRAALVFE